MRLFSNILEIEKEVEVFNFKGVDVIPFQLLNKEVFPFGVLFVICSWILTRNSFIAAH